MFRLTLPLSRSGQVLGREMGAVTLRNRTNTQQNMKTTQHTPGPWSVWKFGESEIDVAVGPEVGGIAVCQVVTSQVNGISTPESMALGQANARLIASAPRLLEERAVLLEALQSIIREPQGKTVDDNPQVLAAIMRTARNAIAKSTKDKSINQAMDIHGHPAAGWSNE